MGLLTPVAFWSLVVWVVFRWTRLPPRVQVGLPRGLLFLGLGALAAAPFLEGRTASVVDLFIGGPYSYPVETVERSRAVVAAGLGAFLVALYGLARWARGRMRLGTLGGAWALSLGVIALRVYLEKLGVSMDVARFFGIIWLTVPLAVLFGLRAAEAGSQRRFWTWLLGYAFGLRVFVVALMLAATGLRLGTHFDNSSITRFVVLGRVLTVEAGSWEQARDLIVMPQLVLWTGVTCAAGLVLGWPVYLFAARRRRPAGGAAA
jgi:hypothetical protein